MKNKILKQVRFTDKCARAPHALLL